MLFSVLTLLNEQIGESEHHSVSTVEEVPAQEMGACNGQTPTRDHLQNPLDLCLGVSVELRGGGKCSGSKIRAPTNSVSLHEVLSYGFY